MRFLSYDRFGIQTTVKVLSSDLKKPIGLSEKRMKRAIRSLKGTVDFHIVLSRHITPQLLDVYVDTDYAGDIWSPTEITRKSTSSGAIVVGACTQATYSRNMKLVTWSSGESEYYGLVKAGSVGIGIRAIYEDLGHPIKIRLLTDASAAKGIASRKGLGKTRHLAVCHLWLQGRVGKKELKDIQT